MTKQRGVAVDLDGCMYPFISVFARNLAWDHGIEISYPTSWDFYKSFGWTGKQFVEEMVRQINDRNLFNSSEPIWGSVKAMQALQDAGFRIIIQTSRLYEGAEAAAVAQTKAWLDLFDFPYDSLHITGSEYKSLDGIDYAFDDAPHNYDFYTNNGVTCVLVDQPWNQGIYGLRSDNVPAAVEMIKLIDTLVTA